MALVYSYGYTNTTAFSTADVTPIDVDLQTNYIKPKTKGTGEVIYKNVTDPVDQSEVIVIRYEKGKAFAQMYPSPYTRDKYTSTSINVSLQGKIRETSSTDDTHIVDHQHSCSVTWRMEDGAAIDKDTMKKDLLRILGILWNDDALGTDNFEKLFNGQIELC